MLVKILAQDIPLFFYYNYYYYYYISEKIRFDILFELLTKQTIYMSWQALFFLKSTDRNTNVVCCSCELHFKCERFIFSGIQ